MAFVPTYQLGPIPLYNIDEDWGGAGDWTEQFQALGYVADGETNEYPWMGQKIVEWDVSTIRFIFIVSSLSITP